MNIYRGKLREIKEELYEGKVSFDACFEDVLKGESGEEIKRRENVRLREDAVNQVSQLVGRVINLACTAKPIITKKGKPWLMYFDGRIFIPEKSS